MKSQRSIERQSNADRRKASTAAVAGAALRLFVLQGYKGTSVEQIGSEAGLTKGAVYFYFKDKEALLLELLMRAEDEVFSPIFAALEASDKTGREKLSSFLQLIGKAGAEKSRELLILPVLMSLEYAGRDDAAERQICEMYDRTRKALGEIIRVGQEDGSLRQNANPEAYATLISSLTDGIILDLYRGKLTVAGNDVARASREMILKSLEA